MQLTEPRPCPPDSGDYTYHPPAGAVARPAGEHVSALLQAILQRVTSIDRRVAIMERQIDHLSNQAAAQAPAEEHAL